MQKTQSVIIRKTLCVVNRWAIYHLRKFLSFYIRVKADLFCFTARQMIIFIIWYCLSLSLWKGDVCWTGRWEVHGEYCCRALSLACWCLPISPSISGRPSLCQDCWLRQAWSGISNFVTLFYCHRVSHWSVEFWWYWWVWNNRENKRSYRRDVR